MARRELQTALSARPRIAQSLDEHLRTVLGDGTVPAQIKELCAAMVSAVNFCEPLLVTHRGAARKLGAPIEKLNDLWDYARSEQFNDAERAALAAAVALSREPRALPPAVWAHLREQYDEGQIAEILCTIGALNYLARLQNAFDTESS